MLRQIASPGYMATGVYGGRSGRLQTDGKPSELVNMQQIRMVAQDKGVTFITACRVLLPMSLRNPLSMSATRSRTATEGSRITSAR